MAVDQGNTNNADLHIDEDEGFYSGTKAALIATGKFKPEWFPGAKGNHKNKMTIEGKDLRTLWPDPLVMNLQISRDEDCKGRKLFYAEIFFTKEESERRQQVEAQKFKELAYAEASALAKNWVLLPNSVDSYKAFCAQRISRQIEIFSDNFSRGGYSFDKKTMRAFDNAVIQLCNTLIYGKVRYDQFFQDQYCMDRAAEAFNRGICLSLTGHERDALVQRFMSEFVTNKAEAVSA